MDKIVVRNNAVSVIIAVFVLLLSSCEHEAVNKEVLRKINFEKEVLPIFFNNCTASGCHGSVNAEEDLNLTSYQGIMQGITAGKPSQSEIYSSITAYWGEMMPPKGALSSAQIATIKLWIEQGAENTKSDVVDDTSTVAANYTVCFTRDIQPIINSNCASCHSNLRTYAGIKSWVKTANPASSKIYESITDNGDDRMPPSPNAALSKANIDSIYNWIKNGALNENCPTLCDTSKYAFAANVFPIISTNCISCHSGSAPSGGVVLSDYTTISVSAASGKLVKSLKGSPLMPPSGALSSCNITVIEKWVNAAHPNN